MRNIPSALQTQFAACLRNKVVPSNSYDFSITAMTHWVTTKDRIHIL